MHNYKYLDDTTFVEAFDAELASQGVPTNERQKAAKLIPTIIKELSEESAQWSERDYGYNPNLDEIIDISQPAQYED